MTVQAAPVRDDIVVRKIEWDAEKFERPKHRDKMARFVFEDNHLSVLMNPRHSELARVGAGVGRDITPEMLRQIAVNTVRSYLSGLSQYLDTLAPSETLMAREHYLADETINEALLRKPGLETAVRQALSD